MASAPNKTRPGTSAGDELELIAKELEAVKDVLIAADEDFGPEGITVAQIVARVLRERADYPRLRAKCSRQRRELRRLNGKLLESRGQIVVAEKRAADAYADRSKLSGAAARAYAETNRLRAEIGELRAEIGELRAENEKLKAREAPEKCATCGEDPRVNNPRVDCYLSDPTAEEILAAERQPPPPAETSPPVHLRSRLAPLASGMTACAWVLPVGEPFGTIEEATCPICLRQLDNDPGDRAFEAEYRARQIPAETSRCAVGGPGELPCRDPNCLEHGGKAER